MIYASEHDIKFNCKKSIVLVRRSILLNKNSIPSFVLEEEKLTEVDDVKYLGHFISSDDKDDKKWPGLINNCMHRVTH